MKVQSDLAGIKFRPKEIKERIATLGEGEVLSLEREPDNKYDENAIRVLDHDGQFLGYVQGYVAKALAPEIDAGTSHVAEVKSFQHGIPILSIYPA